MVQKIIKALNSSRGEVSPIAVIILCFVAAGTIILFSSGLGLGENQELPSIPELTAWNVVNYIGAGVFDVLTFQLGDAFILSILTYLLTGLGVIGVIFLIRGSS